MPKGQGTNSQGNTYSTPGRFFYSNEIQYILSPLMVVKFSVQVGLILLQVQATTIPTEMAATTMQMITGPLITTVVEEPRRIPPPAGPRIHLAPPSLLVEENKLFTIS